MSHQRYKYIVATGTDGSGTTTALSDIRLVGLAYPREYGNFPGLGWTVGAGANEDEIAGKSRFWRLFH
jgi:hypothetical protein